MNPPETVSFSNPCILGGEIRVPGSKSYTHRAYLTALLCGQGTIKHPLESEDTDATRDLCSGDHFNSRIQSASDGIIITAATQPPEIRANRLEAGESGTLLRFLIPITTLLSGPKELILDGHGSLRERDQSEPVKTMLRNGYQIGYVDREGRVPIRIVSGQSIPEQPISLSAKTTSQHLSGWLLALASVGGGQLHLDQTPVSEPYVEMTAEVLREAGVEIERPDSLTYRVGEFPEKPFKYEIPGDYSSAAFFLVAAVVLNTEITLHGLRRTASQADARILSILEELGASVDWNGSRTVHVTGPDAYPGFTVDASSCPDLVPILTVLGSFAEDTVTIENISHLKNKESDRIEVPCRELSKLGVDTEFSDEWIRIHPASDCYQGGRVDAHNDHRIGMALVIFGCRVGNTTIVGTDCVAKSYPGFFDDLKQLGGDWNEG